MIRLFYHSVNSNIIFLLRNKQSCQFLNNERVSGKFPDDFGILFRVKKYSSAFFWSGVQEIRIAVPVAGHYRRCSAESAGQSDIAPLRSVMYGGAICASSRAEKENGPAVRSLSSLVHQQAQPHRGVTTYFPPFPQSPGNPPPGAPFRHPGWRYR